MKPSPAPRTFDADRGDHRQRLDRVLVRHLADLPETVRRRPEPEDLPLTVLFEDDHLLAVDKPAGVLVHPTPAATAARCSTRCTPAGWRSITPLAVSGWRSRRRSLPTWTPC